VFRWPSRSLRSVSSGRGRSSDAVAARARLLARARRAAAAGAAGPAVGRIGGQVHAVHATRDQPRILTPTAFGETDLPLTAGRETALPVAALVVTTLLAVAAVERVALDVNAHGRLRRWHADVATAVQDLAREQSVAAALLGLGLDRLPLLAAVRRLVVGLRRPRASQCGYESTREDPEHAAPICSRTEGFYQSIKLPSVQAEPPVTMLECDVASPSRGDPHSISAVPRRRPPDELGGTPHVRKGVLGTTTGNADCPLLRRYLIRTHVGRWRAQRARSASP
jgi:hypothetical protein